MRFKKENLKSRIFINMFYSYIIIIVLCFLAYSYVVIHEAAALKKEETTQYYRLKLQDIVSVMDKQLINGQNIVSSLNTSSLVNRLYLNTLPDHDTLDSYLLYQALNEIRFIKTASSNLNIYEVTVLFNQYNRAYGSSGVSVLDADFQMPDQIPYIGKTSMKDLFGVSSNKLEFYKDYLIYYDSYKYSADSSRGVICILFDQNSLERSLDNLLTDNISMIMKIGADGSILVGSEKAELISSKDTIFVKESAVIDGVYYEMVVAKSEFSLGYNPVVIVALVIGLLLCAIYVGLAYFFSNKYYKPISSIEHLIADSEGNVNRDEMESIVEGVRNLLSERNDYKERVITITPFAEQGVLQGISKGNLDSENIKILNDEKYIGFQKLYYMATVVNIIWQGNRKEGREDMKTFKQKIISAARALSDSDFLVTAFDKEMNDIYIIINSDMGERLEDFLYKLYSELCHLAGTETILTMGASEVREDISQLYEACSDSVEALKGMLLGGRGAVYFHEGQEQAEKSDYYFPKDGVKVITKIITERDLAGMKAFLADLYQKTMAEEPGLAGMELLLDELYVTVIKALKGISSIYNIKIQLEKPQYTAAFEEILAYYEDALGTVCKQLAALPEKKETVTSADQDIICYVDENYLDSEISLSAIADRFQVSSKYITYLFKNKCGITYLQYVQEKRISYGVQLLRTTSLPLEQISEACGYSSPLTFRRNFKAIMGVNPSDYRQGS